jgi:tetratricopeptide (TPR) repeat protein
VADRAPSGWENLFALCRELDRAPDGQILSVACDAQINRFSALAVPIIGATVIQLDETSPSESGDRAAPSRFFADIENRIAAGRAIHQAMWEENQGRAEAAQNLYGIALEKAPQDPGALSACGNFFFRRGDMERAAILLRRAVEYAPDSAMLLNSLGSALGQMGRDDEALGCFERALQADPLDGRSYYNLALALYPQNRHGEIVRRLEDRLRDTPHFPDGPLWHRRIREKFPR